MEKPPRRYQLLDSVMATQTCPRPTMICPMWEILGSCYCHHFKHSSMVACYSVVMGYRECTTVVECNPTPSHLGRKIQNLPYSSFSLLYTGVREPCGEQLSLKPWICDQRENLTGLTLEFWLVSVHFHRRSGHDCFSTCRTSGTH